MTEGSLRKYPPYKNAADEISRMVERDGYGFIVTMEELQIMLELEEPKDLSQYKQFAFQWMEAVEGLKDELLEEHNICLFNIKGKGYEVLSPDEQVTKAYQKAMRKARRQVGKAKKLLVNVEHKLLSLDSAKDRMNSLKRVAFVESAFKKRKLKEIDQQEEQKLLN